MNENLETTTSTRASARRWGTTAALVAAGLAGGVVLAGTVSANAATSTPTPSTSSSSSSAAAPVAPTNPAAPANPNPGDPSKPQRSDEQLLTGTTLEKVTAAATAAYPDATIVRVETDSDGVYEAHITKADGTPAIIQVGADFTVTGEQTGGPGGGPGGQPPAGASTSGTTSSSSVSG